MFELVILLLPGHMWGSIGVHHLWASLLLQQCPACLFHDGRQVAVYLVPCGVLPPGLVQYCYWTSPELLYNSHNLLSVICLLTVCSIWPIDRTLSGVNTLSQSGPGSNGNEGALHIPQICNARSSASDCLMSSPRHWLGWGLPFCKDVVCVFYIFSWLGYIDWNA